MNTPVEQARNILRGNDLGCYTVPIKGLYPYQWNWNAAFTALGWVSFDDPRAWRPSIPISAD